MSPAPLSGNPALNPALLSLLNPAPRPRGGIRTRWGGYIFKIVFSGGAVDRGSAGFAPHSPGLDFGNWGERKDGQPLSHTLFCWLMEGRLPFFMWLPRAVDERKTMHPLSSARLLPGIEQITLVS